MAQEIEMLANARDVGQATLDVTCSACPVHRWPYDHAEVLRGDLGLSNIVYRIVEDKVHGVLTDCDLSHWKAVLIPGLPESLRRNYSRGGVVSTCIGTTSNPSFYAMLLMCGTIRLDEGRGSHVEWSEEQGGPHALGFIKESSILYTEAIEPSASFEGSRLRLQTGELEGLVICYGPLPYVFIPGPIDGLRVPSR